MQIGLCVPGSGILLFMKLNYWRDMSFCLIPLMEGNSFDVNLHKDLC